jgi:hypothetical protein
VQRPSREALRRPLPDRFLFAALAETAASYAHRAHALYPHRQARTSDDAADRLAARSLGIDDPPSVIGADEAVQAHESEVGVDPSLGKAGGETEDCLGPIHLLGLGASAVIRRVDQDTVCRIKF